MSTRISETLEGLQPGDVLVAAFTGPACNSILPLLGALVIEVGGAMSHAAIIAREYGLPAVIGASEATSRIADGTIVEVDPARGGYVRENESRMFATFGANSLGRPRE